MVLEIPWNLKRSEELGNKILVKWKYLSTEMFGQFLILCPRVEALAMTAGGICIPRPSGPCSTNFIIQDFPSSPKLESKLKVVSNVLENHYTHSQQAFLFSSHYLLVVSGSPYSSFLIPACFPWESFLTQPLTSICFTLHHNSEYLHFCRGWPTKTLVFLQ